VGRIQVLNQQEFKLKMIAQVLNVLGLFLKFSIFFIQTTSHNILAIMFDPCFKNIKIIQNYVGNFIANEIVTKYDTKVVCPFMIQVYFYLNYTRALVELIIFEDDDFFFG
jgi:hypothetical protein